MPKGRFFSYSEDTLLLENQDKTVYELQQLFIKNDFIRSAKSISRRIEKLREEGRIGLKNADTIKRAYKQRGKKRPDVVGFGGPSSDWGSNSSDWAGRSDWGSSDWEDE